MYNSPQVKMFGACFFFCNVSCNCSQVNVCYPKTLSVAKIIHV